MKRLIRKPTINLGHNNPLLKIMSIDFINSKIYNIKIILCIKVKI
jgi:hypothetical protein